MRTIFSRISHELDRNANRIRPANAMERSYVQRSAHYTPLLYYKVVKWVRDQAGPLPAQPYILVLWATHIGRYAIKHSPSESARASEPSRAIVKVLGTLCEHPLPSPRHSLARRCATPRNRALVLSPRRSWATRNTGERRERSLVVPPRNPPPGSPSPTARPYQRKMARTGKESKLERENSCRRDTRILRSLIIKTEKKKQKKKKQKKDKLCRRSWRKEGQRISTRAREKEKGTLIIFYSSLTFPSSLSPSSSLPLSLSPSSFLSLSLSLSLLPLELLEKDRYRRFEKTKKDERVVIASMFRSIHWYASSWSRHSDMGAVADWKKRTGKRGREGEGKQERRKNQWENETEMTLRLSLAGWSRQTGAAKQRQRGEFFIVARFLATVRWRPPLPDQNHTFHLRFSRIYLAIGGVY